jgi:hypothetical protein
VPSRVRIYDLKEFMRFDETGVLDVERSKTLIRQLAAAATFHGTDNILLDLRATTLSAGTMSDILEVAGEFARYESAFKGKIAHVIPDDEERMAIARCLKSLLTMDPRRYGIFRSFEEAIDWLSDVRNDRNP